MSILYLCVVGLFIILWFIRFCSELRDQNLPTEEKPVQENLKKNLQKWGTVFCAALLFRLLMFGLGAILTGILSDETSLSFQDMISAWNRWDSQHYIDLAMYGYKDCIEDGQHLFLVFFPLYPWFVRLFHFLIRDWQCASLAVSVISYAVGCSYFYALIEEEYNSSVARKSLALISLYPFAFFFGSIHTESLFFATMAAGFYYTKKHRWLTVGIIGIPCSLCRVQGVLLLGVAGVEFLLTYSPVTFIREKKIGQFIRHLFTKGIFLLLVPVGSCIYFALNYMVEGDPFRFQMYQQEHWYHSTVLFSQSLQEITGYLFRDTTTNTLRMCIWLPEFILFFLILAALFYGLKRHPLKYTAYLLVYTIVNYSVTFLISGGRYTLCAFPLFIIAAEWCDRHPKIYPWLISVSSILMTMYLTGFFLWKQIM